MGSTMRGFQNNLRVSFFYYSVWLYDLDRRKSEFLIYGLWMGQKMGRSSSYTGKYIHKTQIYHIGIIKVSYNSSIYVLFVCAFLYGYILFVSKA